MWKYWKEIRKCLEGQNETLSCVTSSAKIHKKLYWIIIVNLIDLDLIRQRNSGYIIYMCTTQVSVKLFNCITYSECVRSKLTILSTPWVSSFTSTIPLSCISLRNCDNCVSTHTTIKNPLCHILSNKYTYFLVGWLLYIKR